MQNSAPEGIRPLSHRFPYREDGERVLVEPCIREAGRQLLDQP